MGTPHHRANWFSRFASRISRWAGNPATFFAAILLIVVWGVSGFYFGFTDTWQLVINTGTTIVTFLMVFLIQNSQNRESEALHLKIDELIRTTHRAKNALLDIEDLSAEELDTIKVTYAELAERARKKSDGKKAGLPGRPRSRH